MITKIVLAGFTAILICSCATQKLTLPSPEKIDVFQYGSYIVVYQKNGPSIKGELLAVDDNNTIVLVTSKNTMDTNSVIIPANKIRNYKLQFAQGKDYSHLIPLYTLLTASHGFLAVITLPINLGVLGYVAPGAKPYSYNKYRLPYSKLNMFARFPQGIPPDVDLSKIKR